jgi:hypothetical protein
MVFPGEWSMASCDSKAPEEPAPDGASDDVHDQAQRAADSLKSQIAALRAQVKTAQQTLRDHHKRSRETRSFKR